ncbi:MAG TPA: ABC transporter substrate-binding protein [Gammaproteobacteria bacterium]|jgi:NitT/TauT family transport system substrate-binding protein|nr:ABC transporter substrate-binding protein [Gammaproteobacteria bacterium]
MRARRRFLRLAACALAALTLTGCGGQKAGSAAKEIRIPLGAGGVGFLPLLVMRDRGLIEKHAQAAGLADLTVRWIDLGGPAVMNDALLSGSVDFIAAGPPAFITLWDRTRGGADVRGVAAMTSLPMYLNTTNAGLKSLDDLGAQDKIAVTSVKVSIPSIVMQMYAAAKYGAGEAFRFDRYTVTMTHPDALIALLSGSGQIDAHFTSPPFHQREIKDPKVHTVLSSDDIMGGSTTFTMLSTTAAFRDRNPQAYAAVLGALEEANELIRSDPRAAAEILFKAEASAGFSVEELTEVLSAPDIRFTTTPENTEKYAAFMQQIGSITHKPGSWRDLFFPEIHGAPGS